ncbi:hypothetical protein PWT90_08617 [Aphanocladium album]|nr:hypothetical protein PWT90_08617 [Aphanocladium album]
MPLQDHLDRLGIPAVAFRPGRSLRSTISRSFARRRRRQRRAWTSAPFLTRHKCHVPVAAGAPGFATASSQASAASNSDPSRSLRDDLERAHVQNLPGARIIIARPPSIRYRQAEHSPLLYPAEFISQSRDGRSIMGVLQRMDDINVRIFVPFISHSTRVQRPTSTEELQCILVYNPTSDACEFFCYSHDVALIGESADRSYLVERERIQTIEPGMWTIAVASRNKHGELIAGRPRPVVEFLLLKRKFSGTVTRSRAGNESKPTDSDVRGSQGTETASAETVPVETVAEFVMEPLDPLTGREVRARSPKPIALSMSAERLATIMEEQSLSADSGIFYKLRDGETAHIATTPSGSENPMTTQAYMETATPYQVTRLKKIDRSRRASVFACKHSKIPNTTVVAKALNVKPNGRRSIASLAGHWLHEMRMLENLNHPNIVKLQACDARFFTVYLEHLPDSLAPPYSQKRSFSRQDAAVILRDVASALAYLERQGISHNDIKPRNVAYSRARGAVVLDLGLASLVERAPVMGGTAWYVAPEVADLGQRGHPSNIWALGVTMLFVLGKIDEPESLCEPWDFTNMRVLGSANHDALESWIDELCEAMEDEENGLERDDLVEGTVLGMLDRFPEMRETAAEIEEKLRSAVV